MKTPVFIQTILDAASLSGRHVAGLRGDFRSRLAAFRRNRAASEQAALEEDFSLVLAAWGIADADIPGVISALRLRLPVFAVPMLACLITAAWSHSPVSFLSLACVAPPCLLGMGHDALAHFHFASPSLYAAVPLVVAFPQASVVGRVCLS